MLHTSWFIDWHLDQTYADSCVYSIDLSYLHSEHDFNLASRWISNIEETLNKSSYDSGLAVYNSLNSPDGPTAQTLSNKKDI